MSAQKENTGKKTSNKSGKKKTNKKLEFEKGKVYIPVYKMIIFCACVIAVCVILLLISTIKSNEKKGSKIEIKPELTSVEKDISSLPIQKETPVTKNGESEIPTVTVNESVENKSKRTLDNKASENKSVEVKPADNKPIENKLVENKPTENKSVENKSIENKSTGKKTEDTIKSAEIKSTEINSKKEEKFTEEKTNFNDKFKFPQAKKNAQLVFVFDDGGQNLNHLEKFLQLDFPCTIAVLPGITYSVESAKRVRKSKHELILHQPMQSVNPNVNPGPGAITPEMTEEQIKATLFQNIREIGPIAGLNNHEGSGITADAEKMEIVLKMASEEGIYFLDSRTNVETKVPYVAKEMGYSYYERNVFLDNEKTRENILKELNKGLTIANKNGVAIMIGHVWSADILPEILKEVYPELVQKGYTFKTVSECNGRK